MEQGVRVGGRRGRLGGEHSSYVGGAGFWRWDALKMLVWGLFVGLLAETGVKHGTWSVQLG